jgi:hypothetical protein
MLSRELMNLAGSIEQADRVRSRRVDLYATAQRLRLLAEGVANLEAATVTPNARVIPSEHRHLALIAPSAEPDAASAEQNIEALMNSARLAINRQIETEVQRGMSKIEDMLRLHLSMSRVQHRRAL